MPPAVAAAPLSLHRSRSFLTGIEDKAATDGYEHGENIVALKNLTILAVIIAVAGCLIMTTVEKIKVMLVVCISLLLT